MVARRLVPAWTLRFTLVLAAACSGRSTAIQAPAPCPSVPPPVCPTAEPSVPCDCPSVESAPIAQPAPEPGPGAPDVVVDLTDWPADTKGWYCFEYSYRRGAKSHLTRCSRTKESCEWGIEVIKERTKKGHFKACQPYPRAACFSFHDSVEKFVDTSCHRTYIECVRHLVDSMDSSYPDSVSHHKCVELD